MKTMLDPGGQWKQYLTNNISKMDILPSVVVLSCPIKITWKGSRTVYNAIKLVNIQTISEVDSS